jgi:hypothetical protein
MDLIIYNKGKEFPYFAYSPSLWKIHSETKLPILFKQLEANGSLGRVITDGMEKQIFKSFNFLGEIVGQKGIVRKQ